MWLVYILETKDGRYYTGITNDIERRMKAHKTGKGARFTRIFGFKKLLYSKVVGRTRSEALKIERAIKRLTKLQKTKIITGFRKICKPSRITRKKSKKSTG